MGHTSATNGGPSRLDGHAPPVSGPIGGALTPLCLRSLVDSYDHGRQLFSHQLFDGVWREVDDLYPHETLTSSSIALLGLARSGESGDVHGIDVQRCVDAIGGEVTRTGYRAGIGLALWANAAVDGAVERRLVSHPLPDRVRIRVDLEVVRRATAQRVLHVAHELSTMRVVWCER